MQESTGDPWADEGFGGENDWEAKESVETDLEDDLELEELDLEALDEGDLDDDFEATE